AALLEPVDRLDHLGSPLGGLAADTQGLADLLARLALLPSFRNLCLELWMGAAGAGGLPAPGSLALGPQEGGCFPANLLLRFAPLLVRVDQGLQDVERVGGGENDHGHLGQPG